MNSAKRRVIVKRRDIASRIEREGATILLVSCGGAGSTMFREWLTNANHKVSTPTWKEIGCHLPWPVNTKLKTIFLYGNPIQCFASLKRRAVGRVNGPYHVNVKKLTNNSLALSSDEELLDAMEAQFARWTRSDRSTTAACLMIKQDDLYSVSGHELIRKFLKLPACYPMPEKSSRTSDPHSVADIMIRRKNWITQYEESSSHVLLPVKSVLHRVSNTDTTRIAILEKSVAQLSQRIDALEDLRQKSSN